MINLNAKIKKDDWDLNWFRLKNSQEKKGF